MLPGEDKIRGQHVAAMAEAALARDAYIQACCLAGDSMAEDRDKLVMVASLRWSEAMIIAEAAEGEMDKVGLAIREQHRKAEQESLAKKRH